LHDAAEGTTLGKKHANAERNNGQPPYARLAIDVCKRYNNAHFKLQLEFGQRDGGAGKQPREQHVNGNVYAVRNIAVSDLNGVSKRALDKAMRIT
jgi:hypothetical protein